MKNSYSYFGIATVAVSLFIASPAFAQNISTDGAGGVSVQVGGMKVNAGPGGAQVDTGAGGVKVNAGPGAADVQVGNIHVNTASGTANVSVGDTKVNAGPGGVSVSGPAIGTIQTGSDVATYISSITSADTNIVAATSSSNGVTFSYLEPASLFGFIPLTVPVTATLQNGGESSVSYPWYGFFLSGNRSTIESGVQQAVSGVLGGNTSSLNAQTQATILDIFHSIFKTASVQQ